jgi:hypothetical protein
MNSWSGTLTLFLLTHVPHKQHLMFQDFISRGPLDFLQAGQGLDLDHWWARFILIVGWCNTNPFVG